MLPKDSNFAKRPIILRGDSNNEKLFNFGSTTAQPLVGSAFKSSEIFLGQPCIETPIGVGWRFLFDRSRKPLVDIGGENILNSFSFRGWFKLSGINSDGSWSTLFAYQVNGVNSIICGAFFNLSNNRITIISNQSNQQAVTSFTFPLNNWVYIDIRYRKGTGYKLYFNGENVFTFAMTADMTIANSQFNIGSTLQSSTDRWYGKMQDVVFENIDTYDAAPSVPTDLLYGEITTPNTSYVGDGILSGVVETNGVITVNARVNLYLESTKEYVTSTYTNSSGRYTFNNLNKNKEFTVVIENPDSNWEYKVNSKRIPV